MRSFIVAGFFGLTTALSSSASCTSSVDSCSAVVVSTSTVYTSSTTPASSTASTSFTAATVSTDSTSTAASSSATVFISSTTSTVTFASSSSSAFKTAITVATDGSGQYTAINPAITAAQNAGIPTVTILAGTYTEAVTILGTATVTIVGATASAAAGWSQNQVTILHPTLPFSVNSNSIKGVTLRNINFQNSATTAAGVTANVVSLRGPNIAFYGCSLITSGASAVTSTYGTTFIANSYIEGSDKLFSNFPTVYLYKSTIVPLSSSAIIVYNKGATISGVSYNSTVIFDTSSVQAKSGYTTSNVFLGAPNNGVGSTIIYRSTDLGSLIAGTGFHSSSTPAQTYYGEYLTTGAGSYSKAPLTRASYDVALSASQVSQFTIEKVFGNAFAPFGSSDVSWIDTDVLSSVKASYVSASTVESSSIASSSVASSSSELVSAASTLSSLGATSSQPSATLSSSSASFSNSTISSIPSVAFTTSSASSTNASSSSVSVSPSATSCSAPAPSGTLVVSKTPGPCEYSNVTSAISALPNDSKPYTISIGAGTYAEQISITRNGKVTLVGATSFNNDYTQNQVRLEFSSGRVTNLGQNEQTPVINAKKTNDNSGLAVYNIDFVNSYPQTSNTAALAADFYGANIAAYGCSFIGFQDTLLANKGTQVFSNCYIEGSVDFIWGFSTAYFHQCKIVTNTPGSCIAAQSRATATSVGGYVFDSCMVTYSSTYGNTYGMSYLGRPYSQYSIAVYMNSYIDKHIKDAGWAVWSTSSPQTSGVTFGEYNNTGPGSWQSTTQRASFATSLTDAQAANYALAAWIGDTTWLDMTAYNYVPSYSLTGPSGTTASATPFASATSFTNSTVTSSTTATSTATAPVTNAKFNAHPDSGTTPPAGAVVVSVDGSNNATFTSLTSALASLPSDSTNQTIFLYPGTYNEQVPTVNRAGPVRIIGYVSSSPGKSYQDNQVTISYSRGFAIGTAGGSDAETAVVSTASSRISLYNINMVNTDNLDGSKASYVTLAASIYGNDIAFYGCSFDGWQDTLLTGATAGYQYYESCYIGGAIDFIWGYSKAYFKGCTIGAKRASSCVTAHSRLSASAIGGYIFDQCLFTKAPSSTDVLTNKVFLGRPYSQYAVVVVKNSYIDSTISPAGWKIWSVTDPRTASITFAEYNNSGPSNWENNVAAREGFGHATLLTSDTYSLSSVMDSTEWIDMTYWDSIVTPLSASTIGSTPPNSTVNGTSIYDGTTPPSGALIVSKDAIAGITTYNTIQAALDVAPTSSSKNATIFIYPGVYEEQLIINKSGHTIFQGYSNATGDFAQNQVTIQFSRGADTQGSTGSNTDSATVYATGNYFHAFNINFRNNFGTTQNQASLGFAVKSSKFAALFACQIYGNQDTLSVSGNLFTFKTYIEGNVDFIYGSGSAYFLASTIATNEDGISITAHKRASNTTSAGFVFDQCKVQPATGSGTFTNVGLGRPWNNLSRVAYVNCYFNAMISAAGWNQWSKSSPQTDGVQYGEYHNYGPGAGICNRANFSSQLSDADVVQYQLANFFATTSFIDFGYIDTQPFTVGIGSAQTCTVASSSASSLSVASSTMSSSSILSSSMVSSSAVSSSIPVVTAFTTTTSILKLTASTTITAADVTSTTVVKITSTITETGANVLKTSTAKLTTTVSSTSPDVTSISTSVVTQDVGSTITPDPVTKTSIIKATTTKSTITTQAAETSTAKVTTTITVKSTSTPKAATTTISGGSTVTVTSTITPKGKTTTVQTTTTIIPSTTKTITVDLKNFVTVSSTTTKTTTKKSTTTITCVPTSGSSAPKRMVRRGAIIPRAAASTTTITSTTTVTTYVKTATLTQPGTISTTTVTSVAATKTATLPGTTSTQTITQIAKTVTVNQAGTTVLTTTTITTLIGKTTTLKAATTTVDSTSFVTVTTTSTVTSPVVVVTSYKIATTTQIESASQSTTTITKSSDVTISAKTTIPAGTTTRFATVTAGTGVATVTVTAANKTKTTTVKATSTILSWATKTSKGAAACTK